MSKDIKGFTLVEILLVVTIIVILTALVVPNLAGRGKEAKIAAAKADVSGNISIALDLFEVDNGRYPASQEGLKALIENPADLEDWKGPYIQGETVPKDPWGNEYVYICPGLKNKLAYDLYSLGPDGKEGSDDIAK
jgi:general secretion pathway protein G